MKKILILFVCFVYSIASNADTWSYNGLFYAYSTENNMYEDDNIKLEIIGNEVYLTNKLLEVIYLDPKKTFFYESSGGINETNADEIVSVQPDSRLKIHTFYTDFDHFVYTTRNDLGIVAACKVVQSLPHGHKIWMQGYYLNGSRLRTCPKDESWSNFVEIVGGMYNEIKSNKKKVSASVHLTKNESILTEKVAMAYSLNSDYSNSVSVVVSTWVSDICLAPFVYDEGGTKKKDGFGSGKNKKEKIIVKANSPFENLDEDQETSPIRCFLISFGKGFFVLKDYWSNCGQAEFLGE